MKNKNIKKPYHTPRHIIDYCMGVKIIETDINSGSFLSRAFLNCDKHKSIIGNPPFGDSVMIKI